MSEFDDLMSAGFGEVTAMCGTVISTGKGPTLKAKSCILSNPTFDRQPQNTGYQLDCDSIAEMKRADAVTIGVYPLETDGDRRTITVNGGTYKCVSIEDDPHDPTVRLHLKVQNRTPGL